MNDIYFTTLLKTTIEFNSKHIRNVDNYILDYMKNNYENKCTIEGFIKDDSIQIKKRSCLNCNTNNFSGLISCDIEYIADICKPVTNNIIKCKVIQINKMGIIATNGPIEIVIPYELHNTNEAHTIFKNININNDIQVLVLKSKFKINDTKIQVIGKLFTKNNKLIKVIKK